MRIFVKTEVFESISSEEEIAKLRQGFGRQIEKIMASGKLEMGWVVADGRMPMFIFNVDSAMEVMDLLGNAIIDHCKVETHPIISLEDLAKYFKENAPQG